MAQAPAPGMTVFQYMVYLVKHGIQAIQPFSGFWMYHRPTIASAMLYGNN